MIIQIEPWIGEDELSQLKRVVDSTFVVEHDLTKEFEEKICELTGARHAIAMTNGTVALFCCLKALGIGPGDEVIVPNLTFIATSNAVIMAGATPVLCDVDPNTFCMTATAAEKCISEKTRALMPVHLYGQSANMVALNDLARRHNLKVIEDAAQGTGVFYEGKHVGTYGDLGILSFYGNKTITCGEGGVVLTDDDELRTLCYRLKNHGRDGKGTFLHEHIGYNFCFTEMQAAIGIAQLQKLPAIIKKKKEIHDLYCESLSYLGEKMAPAAAVKGCSPVYWFTSFVTPHKTELINFLKEEGIQTREFFYPLDKQPCYKDGHVKRVGNYSTSMTAFETGISLPSSYNLTHADQRLVIDAVKRFFSERGN